MAHYRNLAIGDKKYRYNIGKKFVVIIDPDGSRDEVLKDQIGFMKGNGILITPKMIRDFITGNLSIDPARYFDTCRCECVDKRIGALPFEAEIEERLVYVYYCENCFDENADNI